MTELPLLWDRGRLVVTDPEGLKRINRPYLSPSSADTIASCPARFAAEKLMPWHDDPFGAAEIGTSGHALLEDLYGKPVTERTRRVARDLLNEVAARTDGIAPTKEDPYRTHRWKAAVWQKVRGIFDIENPSKVIVRRREWKLDGVEIGGVPFLGIIDRADIASDGRDSGTSIADYKTGRFQAAGLPWGDHHGDQLRLYAAAVTAFDGRPPIDARVVYTAHGKDRFISLSKREMTDTLRRFAASWDTLQATIAEESFPTRTSKLCAYCPLVNSCPAAKAEGTRAHPTNTNLVDVPVLLHRNPDLDEEPPVDDDDLVELPPDLSTLSVRDGTDLEHDGVPVDDAEWHEMAFASFAAQVDSEAPLSPVEPEVGGASDQTAHMNSHAPSTARGPGVETEEDMLTEAKPWDESTGDGTLNPTSYAAVGVFGTVELAVEELSKADWPVNRKTVDSFSATLALMVQAAQESLTGSTSWQAGANTRVRGALRSTLTVIPAPFGGDAAAWEAWVEQVTKRLKAICSAAIRLWEQEPDEQPWKDLAVVNEVEDDFAA